MTISDNNFTHNSGSEQSGGIKNIRIDFTAIAGITDAHLRIAEALQFPDHYGKNLDALFKTEAADRIFSRLPFAEYTKLSVV